MRIVETTAGTAIMLCLTLAPIDAASKGKGSAPTKVSSSHPPAATPSAKATKAPKVTTTSGAPTTTTTAQTKPGKAETKSAKKSGTTSTTPSLTTTTTPGTTTTGTTTTTKIDFTQGKVADQLTKNTKLAEKLANQLKAMGYAGDVYEAAYGFKSLGGFVSTVNNAQNQNLSFEQLKALRTGMSVDADGVVLYANRNLDGTVTMVPLEKVTNPAPTQSLGQAKKTLQTSSTTTTTVTN